MAKIKVGVNGAKGKMGQASCAAIAADADLDLVFEADQGDDLSSKVKDSGAKVVVDFTQASVFFQNASAIVEAGASPVIGTSGFTESDVAKLKSLCAAKSLGGIIAPNFSISAVLMMKYASDAAKYLPDVEIVEYHHDKKEDSPSGTAVKTAELIRESLGKDLPEKPNKDIIPGGRGASMAGVHIHSIRVPGVIANQEVVFGGLGQTLKIASYTINRESFMPGVCLACKKVMGLDELVYGLEHVL